MTDQEDDKWGDDIFSLVTSRVIGDSQLASEAEERVRERYRLELRPLFESDQNVRESLSGDQPASECRQWVLDSLSGRARPGTESVFEQVVDELLKELDHFRSLPPAMYLIDGRGQAIMPLTETALYQPPDFLDEAGNVRKARQIVHPGITSALAMKAQETSRAGNILVRAKAAGALGSMATTHERDPSAVTEAASEWLEARGVTRGSGGGVESIRFGRENVAGMSQSPNYGFHRVRVLGEVLGRKILDALGGAGSFEVLELLTDSDSRHRWYEARVSLSPTQTV